MTIVRAEFHVGQVVTHNKFGYRGVIYDIDPVFSLSDEWYEQVATSRPPKDRPWYRVLREGGQETYVAERHLDVEPEPQPVEHPEVFTHFDAFRGGCYVRDRALN